MSSSEVRTRTVSKAIRLSHEEERTILEAAGAGVSFSRFVREAALARAAEHPGAHRGMTGAQATAANRAVAEILAKHNPIFQDEEQGWFCFDGTSDHAQFEDLCEWGVHVAPLVVAAVDGAMRYVR